MRYAIDHTPVRHSGRLFASQVEFRVCPPARHSRVAVAHALRQAVDRLRTVEAAFRRRPLGRPPRHRLGEGSNPLPAGQGSGGLLAEEPLHAAITAAVMAGCRRVRQRTGGYFDPWAMPGGFDPRGLLTGWALERAATALTDAGVTDFAIMAGDELLLRGAAPTGRLWRVGVRHPHGEIGIAVTDTGVSTSVAGVVDPRTQTRADHWDAATVLGPDLGIADAYATALRAAGPAGLTWFPTPDGYRTVLLTEPALPLPTAA